MDDAEIEGSSEDEQAQDLDSEASEDGDDEEPPSRPYLTLLQSLNETNIPKAKRRKLSHSSSPRNALNPPSEQPEEGNDEPGDIDRIEEEEDEENGVDPEEQAQDDSSSDSDDGVTSADPFDAHIAQPDDLIVAGAVQAIKSEQWVTKRTLLQSLRVTLMSPGLETDLELPESATQADSLKLKPKLRETARKVLDSMRGSQKALMPLLFGYWDVLQCDRTAANSLGLRQLVCLHALNHAFKCD